MTTDIKQLPSGFYSVWINNNWIEASAPTQEAAERILAEYLKQYGRRPSK